MITHTIVVLGPGSLGLSFARHAAQQGFSVRLIGRNAHHAEAHLQRALIRWNATDAPWRASIAACSDLETALTGADAILEALPEDLETKAGAWKQIDALADPATLRLTGTSSLSVKRIREAARIPPGLVGFHLFVPVHRMRVLELICETETPIGIQKHATELGKALGLRVISVGDQPGFAASRMALVQGLEAMRLLEQGIASAEDLDALMVMGYGHPIGPLELSDRVGLDLRLAIARQIHESTHDPRFAPPSILQRLVTDGSTGRAVGQGFFAWDGQGQKR